MTECIFCSLKKIEETIFFEDPLFYAKWDGFPVSKGHALIIPKRHVESFFDLNEEEQKVFFEILQDVREEIDAIHEPDAYNIGVNEGAAAGRTIDHLHIHVIPRYKGDVKDPKGGIRHVIPGKGDYHEH